MKPGPLDRIVNIFASGTMTFGLRQNIMVAVCAVAVSIAGAVLAR
jgi:hypothetical protein